MTTDDKKAADPEAFCKVCEDAKDLPPEEQARRVHRHFGVFGGMRPTSRTKSTPSHGE
jgi:hypothetical protein